MSDWISVEDRLPDTGRRVMAWHENWGVEITYLLCGYLPLGLSGDRAAYWQELPEPPKENSDED